MIAGNHSIMYQRLFGAGSGPELLLGTDDYFTGEVFFVRLMMAMGFTRRSAFVLQVYAASFKMMRRCINEAMLCCRRMRLILRRTGCSVQTQGLNHNEQQQQMSDRIEKPAHAKDFNEGAKVYFIC